MASTSGQLPAHEMGRKLPRSYTKGCLNLLVGDGAVYDPVLREAQLVAQKSVMGLQIATKFIRDKIANSCDTLGALPPLPVVDTASDKLQAALEGLHEMPPESIDKLLLTEANAANAYFAA
jgi:CRISPR/Cas system-associated endonuclease Cas1